ncbi:MAG: PorV/PorQ family protein [Bacteroidetes bacterium]|nr:PorV/PorQ family protein [Bacteroidota bacterium]
MRNCKQILQAIAFVALSNTLYAQVKYSNEFLRIGVGARALGMGNASIATVSDASSGYWNPAGLLHLKSNLEVSLMHNEYFAGIAKYDYGAIAARIDSSSVASLNIIRVAVDDIPNTTQLIDANGYLDYDRISTFSAADYAFIFSYAKQLKIPGLRLGGSAKIIRRTVGDFGGAWGFGLDAGAQYDYKKWHLAAMIRDVTSTFNAWSYSLDPQTIAVFQQTGNKIPENSVEVTKPGLHLGGARKFTFKEKFSLMAELDLITTFDRKRNTLIKSNFASIDPCIGIEAGFKDFIFLRTGIGNFQTITDITGSTVHTLQPNIGVGVKIKALTLDYALTNIGEAVGLYSNVFSLKLGINKHAHK